MTRLAEVLPSRTGGYWGVEAGGSDVDARAIRNGDVGTSGELRWDALPLRGFTEREFDKARVHAGDIVLTTSGNCGNVAYIGGEPTEPTVATNFVRVLRVDPLKVDSRYAFHYLRSGWFDAGIAPFVRGATIKNLSVKSAFETIEIPLPSLSDQRRIAAILDHADALRAKRRQVLTHLEALTRSVFRSAFADVPETSRLGDVATTTSGGTPNRSVSSNYGGGIPWVKSGELHAGLVTETEETISAKGLSSSSAKVFPAGTVLLAMYGATAGVVGRLGVDAATNQAICAITSGPSLNAEYLIAALRAQTVQLVAKAAGGAQPNLSQGIIRDIVIPLPSLEDQQRFASQVAAIDTQRSEVVRAQTMDDDLFASLQSRAFRGEL